MTHLNAIEAFLALQVKRGERITKDHTALQLPDYHAVMISIKYQGVYASKAA